MCGFSRHVPISKPLYANPLGGWIGGRGGKGRVSGKAIDGRFTAVVEMPRRPSTRNAVPLLPGIRVTTKSSTLTPDTIPWRPVIVNAFSVPTWYDAPTPWPVALPLM